MNNEILRSYEQIVDSFKKVFDIDVANLPILNEMQDRDLKSMADKANITNYIEKVQHLAMLIFQLNDFRFAVANIFKIFLYTKSYKEIIAFLQIMHTSCFDNASYVSKNKLYNSYERLFDFAIQVAVFADVDKNEIANFAFYCANDNSELYFLNEIAKEYLDFVAVDDTSKNTTGIAEIDSNRKNDNCTLNDIKISEGMEDQNILKNYREIENMQSKESSFENQVQIENNDNKPTINDENACTGNDVVEVFDNNVKVINQEEKAHIDEQVIFCKEQEDAIVNFDFLQNTESFIIQSKNIEFAFSRSLDVSFISNRLFYATGEETLNEGKTLLINCFKQAKDVKDYGKLDGVFNVFLGGTLSAFANKLFVKLCGKKDILCAKWCVRFACFVCVDDHLQYVKDTMADFLLQGREKEANYIYYCLKNFGKVVDDL